MRESQGRCPECGRAFDPRRARSYAKRPRSPIRRWALRGACFGLVLLLVVFALCMAVWSGWSSEQRRLETLHGRLGSSPNGFEVSYQSIEPWLGQRLPPRAALYLQRVSGLEIYSEDVTDQDLETIRGFGRLHKLMLQSGNVTDAGFVHLRGLAHMRNLELYCPRLTDAGLAPLEDMRQMEDVFIASDRITDASLTHLENMPRLREITVCQTPITREALYAWMRRHPAVSVIDGPDGDLRLHH
ncbi:MAG TPA: hypothetical protein VLJ39_16095 [Tepidisphaeraceae bacterium]|nr:hypothetical protein [Tepidisphaeraceae bacterium]